MREGTVILPGCDDDTRVGHGDGVVVVVVVVAVVVVRQFPLGSCICWKCTLRYEDQGFDMERL